MDRHEHAIERIGKKYQWIAYWELVGYLADHHWYLDWEQLPSTFDRVDDFDPLDIDASFLIRKAEDQSNESVPSLKLPATDFQGSDVSADLAWVRGLDELPDVTAVVEKVDSHGVRWWTVRVYGRDTRYLDKLKSNGPMRTGQRWIELIVVPMDKVTEFFEKIRDTSISGSDLFDRGNAVQRLVGEHTPELIDLREPKTVLSEEHLGVKFGRLSVSLRPNRGEFDHSEAVGEFAAPEDWLMKALNLRVRGPQSKSFVSPDGHLAFLDARFPDEIDGPVVINADMLAPVLDSNGLVPVWLLGAEKDGGLGTGPRMEWSAQIDRRSFGGMWWRDNGNWRGATWASKGD